MSALINSQQTARLKPLPWKMGCNLVLPLLLLFCGACSDANVTTKFAQAPVAANAKKTKLAYAITSIPYTPSVPSDPELPPPNGGETEHDYYQSIYAYSIDPVSGKPSLLGKTADQLLPHTGMKSIATHPTLPTMYMLTGQSDDCAEDKHPCGPSINTFVINPDTGMLQTVGTPVDAIDAPPPGSLVMDPLGKFLYLLGSSKFAVYSIDQITGLPTLSAVQSFALGQLIISPSGLFAYGSINGILNGILYTFTIDRGTGLFVQVGSPVSFTRWLLSDEGTPPPPYHNMVADPNWKFLYIIGGASNYIDADEPYGEETAPSSQGGSAIYTYIIDQATGVLTLSGPPIDTSPEIITWGAADPTGNFIYFLNTWEKTGSDDPGPILPSSIFSYYVRQDSGQLVPTGRVEAGVAADVRSGSISVDLSGKFLYLLNAADVWVYNIDPAVGTLTVIGTPLSGATATTFPAGTPQSFTLVGF